MSDSIREGETVLTVLRPSDVAVVGERIRKARDAKGWTQLELAAVSGISQGLISAIENGKVASPSVKTLTRLALALGLPLADLTLEPDPPEESELPQDLREQIRALPPDMREAVSQLIGQRRSLPDTPEGRAAWAAAIRAAVLYLKGWLQEHGEDSTPTP
jgi:transcriptional regulator with XRE-family HTH domain